MPAPRRKRTVSIYNGHPLLRLTPRSVHAAIHCLDEVYRFLPADLPFLSRAKSNLPPKDQATGLQSGSCVPEGEISIAFLTDAALARLHATFLDDPAPTDVITFEGAPHLQQGGEICISVDTARTYALRHDRSFAEELTLYIVHGWLHLAGYDDLVPAKKKKMRAAEARAMGVLSSTAKQPAFSLGR